jgi:hypothetical protein
MRLRSQRTSRDDRSSLCGGVGELIGEQIGRREARQLCNAGMAMINAPETEGRLRLGPGEGREDDEKLAGVLAGLGCPNGRSFQPWSFVPVIPRTSPDQR